MVKAQLDVQYNWVFILIAGTVILSFFVGAAVWYKNTQEQKITANIVVNIESILKTAKENPKTAQTTTIPDVSLAFTCSLECSDYGCASDFSGGGISRTTETEIVFALDAIQGTQLITWALEWNLPYKIANFLYVTTDHIRYILVYDESSSSLALAVNSLLAENSYLTKETIKVDEITSLVLTDKNDMHVRVISFIGELPSSAFTDIDDSIDVIIVEGNDEKGTVTFDDGEADYYGMPLLIGALFSANKEFYSCNVQKALLQGKMVSEVYAARTKALYVSFGTEKEYCTYYFDETIQDAITGIPEGLEDNTDISSEIETLEEANDYAIIKGCPRLY
jgi:hypothetical protein